MPILINKVRSKRRAFTLLEIFICLMILSVAGGALGWHVKGLYDHHQLHAAGRRLTTKLKELQLLALSYQTEMKLELVAAPEGILYRAITDEPLKGFNRKKALLGSGCDFKVKGEKKKYYLLTIDAMGRVAPSEKIEIQRREAKADQPKIVTDLSTPLQIKTVLTSISGAPRP